MATLHQFPLDKEDVKYEAKVTFNARKIKAFDVDFLFDAAGLPTKNIETEEDFRSFDRRLEAQRLREFNATILIKTLYQVPINNLKGGPKVRLFFIYLRLYKLQIQLNTIISIWVYLEQVLKQDCSKEELFYLLL